MSKVKFSFKRMWRKFRYKSGVVYSFDIDRIIISDCFRETTPIKSKYIAKLKQYELFGSIKKPIRINRDFVLVDGYIDYLILRERGESIVPVTFVE